MKYCRYTKLHLDDDLAVKVWEDGTLTLVWGSCKQFHRTVPFGWTLGHLVGGISAAMHMSGHLEPVVHDRLSETQASVLDSALHGTRGYRGLIDVAGYGAGVFASARALARKGALRPLGGGDPATADEFIITDLGRKLLDSYRRARKREGS